MLKLLKERIDNKENMNVAYHSSDTFSSILAVSMVSIMENNKSMEDITFYVLEKQISEHNKQKLKEMVESYGRKIVLIPMPDMQKDFNFPIARVRKKWILDSYCRLFLGSILPKDVERVLYLDCDTLCHGDLQEFWGMDLQGCYCGAVTDAVGEHYYELFNMNKTSRYCNSGMVLFDLKRWREDGMEDKVAEYVREKNGFVFFMEQSVMNIVLQDKINILHPKYNTYTLISELTYQELKWLRHCKRFYSKQECDEARRDPRLIHLTNLFLVKGRPWLEGNNHPYKDIFMNYRKLTPWKNEPLMTQKLSALKRIQMSIINMLPHWISLPLIGIVYEYIRPKQIARQHA